MTLTYWAIEVQSSGLWIDPKCTASVVYSSCGGVSAISLTMMHRCYYIATLVTVVFGASSSLECVDPIEYDKMPILYTTTGQDNTKHFSAPDRNVSMALDSFIACAWRVIPKEGKLEILFFNLKLNVHENCVDEFVSLYHDIKSDPITKFCGTQDQYFNFEADDSIIVIFKSTFEGSSFDMQYSEVEANYEPWWQRALGLLSFGIVPIGVIIFIMHMKKLSRRNTSAREPGTERQQEDPAPPLGFQTDPPKNNTQNGDNMASLPPLYPPPPYPPPPYPPPPEGFGAVPFSGNMQNIDDNPTYRSQFTYSSPGQDQSRT